MRDHLQEMAGDVVARCAPRTVVLQGIGRKSRRRKMAVARLGGRSARPRRRFLGTTALRRRLRLRWVTALYRRALRRLRAACASKAVQRILEGAALVGVVRLDTGV